MHPRSSHFAAPSPPTAGLVVWESDARWSAFWRRELGKSVPIREVRHAEEAWDRLQVLPHGVLAVALSAQQAPHMIALLAHVQVELPAVLCIAHLACELTEWEMVVREAGAKFMINAPWQLAAQAPQLVRHLANAPQPALRMRDEIWQRLPWPATVNKSINENSSA